MARDTTISPSAAGPSVISAEGGVIDVTRLRVALARLSRRLRRHELAGLTPTQLAALSTVEQAGPLRLALSELSVPDLAEARITVYTPCDEDTRARLPLTRRTGTATSVAL